MADVPLRTLFRQLKEALRPPADGGVSDARLLERYLAAGDPTALELLVWRHERMVWGVCRRVLRDAHDAADAFQATFLTLVRKAGSIRNQDSVASWLYKVAYRVALRARTAAARRALREHPEADLTAAADPRPDAPDADWEALKPFLDRAVSALPEKYRSAVVLCYLEGKTYTEAAGLLDCPKGTVSIRLTRARALLRRELTRRGVAPSAGLLAAALREQAVAAGVPAALVTSTVRAAAGGASPRVAALTEATVRAMILSKFQMVAAVVLAVGVVAVPAGVALSPRPAAEPPASQAQGKALAPAPAAEKAAAPMPLKGHAGEVMAVAFSPDGTRLATAGADQAVKVWDVATGREVASLNRHTDPLYSVAFFPEGKLLAAAGGIHDSRKGTSRGEVKVWDVTTGRELYNLVGFVGPVYGIAVSADGKRLVTAGGGNESEVILWDATTGQKLSATRKTRDGVLAVALSRDGKWVAVGGNDRTVRVWDAEAGEESRTLKGHNDPVRGVAFSPDGRSVASAGVDRTVRVWDVATGQLVRNITAAERGWINAVAFSPDGRLVASGGNDTIVRVWDVATGKELVEFRDHDGNVNGVAFSPDGRWLATASNDRTARLFPLKLGAAASEKGPAAAKPADGNARQVTAAFVTAALAGKADDARTFWKAGQMSPKRVEEIQGLGVKTLGIGLVVADGAEALALSDSVTDDRGRKGYLLFTLVREENRWVIRDIDFAEPDRTLEKQRKFLEDHAEAKAVPDQRPAKKGG